MGSRRPPVQNPIMPVPPNQGEGDIGVGGGPGIPPRFPKGRKRRRRAERRMPPREPVTGPRPKPPIDDLGPPPEREVPIPRERRQRISRRSDPSGRAPFSPDERAMARDRFFEKMFERSDERRQQRSMEREERDNLRDSLRSERDRRESEDAVLKEGRRRRRRRRGRRRDFTRRRSRMEGGRRGRSGREMAAFRDRYVSTLGSNFFS